MKNKSTSDSSTNLDYKTLCQYLVGGSFTLFGIIITLMVKLQEANVAIRKSEAQIQTLTGECVSLRNQLGNYKKHVDEKKPEGYTVVHKVCIVPPEELRASEGNFMDTKPSNRFEAKPSEPQEPANLVSEQPMAKPDLAEKSNARTDQSVRNSDTLSAQKPITFEEEKSVGVKQN